MHIKRLTLIVFLLIINLTGYAQSKVTASKKAITAEKRSVFAPPQKQWGWLSSGREIRQMVLTEAGWFPATPSDSCQYCTAFSGTNYCRMEFAYNPTGLWQRTWKMPKDSHEAKQWASAVQKMQPATHSGADLGNEWITEANDSFTTFLWRQDCGDFVIYIAVGQDRGGTPGFGLVGRKLRDCNGEVSH